MPRALHTSNLVIKKWAEEDRPREKLVLKGRSTLSHAELIGILIASGTRQHTAVDLAKNVLASVDNDLDALARMSVKDLMRFKGIGEAKAISIVAALELGRRRKTSGSRSKPKIKSPADAFELMRPHLMDLTREEFWILLLNRANHVVRMQPISSGGVSGTVVDPRLIFKEAVDHLASGVILMHNHPSGNLRPSEADLKITQKLVDGGKYLDIPVLDHIIFCNQGYLSFKDEGLL